MATIYKIKIKTVSAFANYDEEHVKALFEIFLRDYSHPVTGLKFEGTEIDVERS